MVPIGRRAFARLAVPVTLAMLATSLTLPAGTAASGPPDRPVLLDEASSSDTPIPDLGRKPVDALDPSGRAYAPGVVLVAYRAGASASERGASRHAAHARSHGPVSKLAPDLERLQLEPGSSVPEALRALRGRGAVRFAEPDYAITVEHDAFDEIYTGGYMWGLYGANSVPQNSWGSAAAEAWKLNQVGTRDVYVGVVDTGIEIAHKDLAPNIWTNPFETPGNGLDDDDNGYVDDTHGWDFFHDDATVYDAASADYHGTHVAGTIGAAGSNGEGTVGVNWAVTMIPAKFIHGEGFVSGAVAALDYLTDLKTRHGLNIVATNNSWGGPEESSALEDAINRGGDAGILFVAAAGNDGVDTDATPTFPASHACDTRFDTGDPRGFDCLISVAAITDTGALAGFSNYGATSVDIGAPGQQIASTYPGGQYAYLSGTSMAAPHVTGALALLASCQSAPTPDGLQASLYTRAVATPSLAGVTTTGGRVHVGQMMADCDTGGPPRVLLTARAGGTDAPAQFWVWFTEPVTGLEPGDFSVAGTSTGWGVGEIYYYGNPAGPYVLNVDATSPPVGTLSVTLAAGSVMGSLAGPAAPFTITTTIDRAAPTVTAPAASIKTGLSLSGSAIPLQLTWNGSDAETGVRFYELQYSTNGGSTWHILSSYLVGPSAIVTVSPSGSMRFRVRANDWAGHASGFPAGPTFSPRLVQQSASAVTYSGAWSLGKYASFSGGSVRYTGVGKRSATYSFTGRAVGFVTTLASSRGVVKIKVDGVQVARIDLGSSPTAFRRLVWSRTFSTVKAHKVQVVVVGGYGRVDVDAFVVLK